MSCGVESVSVLPNDTVPPPLIWFVVPLTVTAELARLALGSAVMRALGIVPLVKLLALPTVAVTLDMFPTLFVVRCHAELTQS